MTLFDFVTYSIWISVGIGLLFFSRIKTNSIKLLICFQVIGILSDIFLIYILPKEKGNFIKTFYCILKPFEYTVYAIVLNSNIAKKGLKYYYLLASITVIFIFSIFTLLFRINTKSAANNIILLEGVLVIIIVLLYFKDILKSKEIIFLSKTPQFIIAVGILLFFTGNIIATGFYHQLKIQSPDLAKSLYKLMNHSLGIFQSIMFGYAYFVDSKTLKNE